jgi:hypothetical protein
VTISAPSFDQQGRFDLTLAPGNGWAAAGMLRVHATIKNSQFASSLKGEKKDLEKWVEEIHKAVYSHVVRFHRLQVH